MLRENQKKKTGKTEKEINQRQKSRRKSREKQGKIKRHCLTIEKKSGARVCVKMS